MVVAPSPDPGHDRPHPAAPVNQSGVNRGKGLHPPRQSRSSNEERIGEAGEAMSVETEKRKAF